MERDLSQQKTPQGGVEIHVLSMGLCYVMARHLQARGCESSVKRLLFFFFLFSNINYIIVSITNAISKYKPIMVHFRGG